MPQKPSPTGETPVPQADVWSHTPRRHRRRAIVLLLLNLLLYCGLCVFTYWLHLAKPFDFSWESYAAPFDFWGPQRQNLNDFILYPINVERTPMHGVVLGLLVAAIVAVPISVALLYRFASALPFVAAVVVFAHMPWMAVTLLSSCVLASVRPFRMSFQFGSALVGLLPVLLYLYLSTRPSPEQLASLGSPEQKLVLIGPWILAVLAACVMLGVILLIARIVQYRPGAVAPVMAVMFATPAILFHYNVGVDELRYRVLELEYGPRSKRFEPVQDATEKINELFLRWTRAGPLDEHGRSALRAIWSERREDLLALKSRVVRKINLEVLANRRDGIEAWDDFIGDHPKSAYVPCALFVQARTFDTRLDERKLIGESAQRELYADFPHVQSERIWAALLAQYPDSPLAITARVRLAQLRLRSGDTGGAAQLLAALPDPTGPSARPSPSPPATQPGLLRLLESEPPEASLEFDPAPYLLEGRRLYELICANRDDPRHGDRPLHELAGLDPHRPQYQAELARLAERYPDALLRDNLVLRWVVTTVSRNDQADHLVRFVDEYPDGDALPEAMFRLGEIEVQAAGAENEARRTAGIARLREVVRRFGDSTWAADAAERLRFIEPAPIKTSAAAVRP
jgi:outer membrane protein assembly factor BamD (BamD/ComL family)